MEHENNMNFCNDKFCIKGELTNYNEKIIEAGSYKEYLDKMNKLLEEDAIDEANGNDSGYKFTRFKMQMIEK